MSGIATRKMRIYNAQQFKEAFNEASPTRMYVAVGRVQPWDDDNNPPDFVDTYSNTVYNIWRSFYAAKKITPNDVSFVVPRYDWQANTVYTEYNDKRKDLYDSDHYVLTDERNVYKCLFNNNGRQSNEKPTGTSTSNIQTSDGYIWKFMFSVSAADALKFLTNDYMPVKVLSGDDGSAQYQVETTSSNGSIEIIDVSNTGSGYFATSGTFSSVANSSVMSLDTSASTLFNIYTDSSVYIDGGLGAGQVDKIIDYNGSNRTIYLEDGFTQTPNTSSTYSIAPTITINGDGSSALAYANVESGGVTKVNMIDTGQNYSYANVSITANNGGGATAIPYLSPTGGHGSNSFVEFSGHNVMLNVNLEGNEANTIPLNNEFRVVGLIADPIENNGSFANNINYDMATTLKLSSINGSFQSDELVVGQTTNTKARVVQYANNTSSTGEMRVNENVTDFILNEIITGSNTGSVGTIDDITNPELRIYGDNLLYVDNKTPISRSTDQSEDIKLTVRF